MLKPKMRVVDIPNAATAVEAEALLNGPCDDGYYNHYQTAIGLPEGISLRFFYRLRAKPERDE